jgi:hypothetical protein
MHRRMLNETVQEGIIPAWEDEANKNGGKWSIQLPKDKNRAHVDKMWLYTVRYDCAQLRGARGLQCTDRHGCVVDACCDRRNV